MLLVSIIIMGIFTGCGNSAETSGNGNTGSIFQETITISEMLNSIIEDEGHVVVYSTFSSDYKEPIETTSGGVVAHDGKKDIDLTAGYDTPPYTFKEFLALDAAEIDEKLKEGSEDTIRFNLYVPEGDGVVTAQTSTLADFGSFSRVEIDGKSCMVFELYRYNNGVCNGVFRTIIKDTEYTKDKIVVFDSVSSESENMQIFEKHPYNMNCILSPEKPE